MESTTIYACIVEPIPIYNVNRKDVRWETAASVYNLTSSNQLRWVYGSLKKGTQIIYTGYVPVEVISLIIFFYCVGTFFFAITWLISISVLV